MRIPKILGTMLCALGLQTSAANADDLETIGDILQIASPAYGLYMSHQLNGREGLNKCGSAIFVTALTTTVVKEVVNAPRPNGGDLGFPSGHTSSAAVGFGCALGQTGWSTTTWVLGAATLLTGYSRVEGDFHTWEQVGAGFALGAAVGYFNTRHLAGPGKLQYGITRGGRQALTMNMDF